MAKLELSPAAQADLIALADLIEAEGGRGRADADRARVLRALRSLEVFPSAGRERPQIGPGVHLLGLERRATILFRSSADTVLILRILYASRQP